jgi:hypothetical protein
MISSSNAAIVPYENHKTGARSGTESRFLLRWVIGCNVLVWAKVHCSLIAHWMNIAFAHATKQTAMETSHTRDIMTTTHKKTDGGTKKGRHQRWTTGKLR